MKWAVLICFFSFALAMCSESFAEEGVTEHQDVRASAEDTAIRFVTGLIDRDVTGIRSASLRPYGPQPIREEYDSRLNQFVATIENGGLENSLPPEAPKRIEKVFAARPLSSNGPASYGYAAFDFMDVAFVDVVVQRNDGPESLYRILVVQDRDRLWYAHPFPDLSPLLSAGLENEAPSTVESRGFKTPTN